MISLPYWLKNLPHRARGVKQEAMRLANVGTLAELRDIDELSPDLFADFEAQAKAAEAELPRGDTDEDGDDAVELAAVPSPDGVGDPH